MLCLEQGLLRYLYTRMKTAKCHSGVKLIYFNKCAICTKTFLLHFFFSIVSQCKSLESLSLSANPKIDNNDVQELLEAASRYESGKLSSILLNGCSLASPFSTCFLDGMNDKLNHNYPLQHLEFTSKSVNKMDCDALRDIWVARWSDQAKVDTAPFRIVLSTTVMKDQLL